VLRLAESQRASDFSDWRSGSNHSLLTSPLSAATKVHARSDTQHTLGTRADYELQKREEVSLLQLLALSAALCHPDVKSQNHTVSLRSLLIGASCLVMSGDVCGVLLVFVVRCVRCSAGVACLIFSSASFF
jgi:hypothetical protein